MRGSIRQREKGVWEVRAFVGRDALTRRPRQISRVVHGGKREAEKRLHELLAEVAQGGHHPTKVSFGTLLDRWSEQAERLGRSPVTLRAMHSTLEHVIRPELGHIDIRRLGPADLDAFYAKQGKAGKSAGTIRRYHSHISAALALAVRWGWISSNPARLASPPPRARTSVTPPEIEGVRTLLREADAREPALAAALALAALTGARRAELCGLRWGDFDEAKSRLTIQRAVVRGQGLREIVVKETKSGRSRRIALDPISLAILGRQRRIVEERAAAADCSLAANSFVFSPLPDGSVPYNPEILTVLVHRLRDKAGMPDLRLHDLRHFAATQLVAAGVDVRTVAGRLGHSSPSITLDIYAHFIEDADREAARRMGELFGDTLSGPPQEETE